MFILLKRVIRLGWKNFSRSTGLSLVGIVVLMATIFLTTSLLLLQEITQEIVKDIEEKADISVEFNLAAPEERIFRVKEDLEEEFDLVAINYLSREEVLEEFKRRHRDDPVMMEALDEVGNPFSAILNIKAREVQDYREVSDFIRRNHSDIISDIDFYGRKEVIEEIFSVTSRVQRSIIIASIILGVIAVLIVLGTTKLSIYSIGQEIKVMRLVGASNWYIQGSFLTQGFITGLIASLASLFLLLFLSFAIYQGYNIFNLDLEKHILGNFSLILLLQFGTGIGLSLFASIVAVSRYLKV